MWVHRYRYTRPLYMQMYCCLYIYSMSSTLVQLYVIRVLFSQSVVSRLCAVNSPKLSRAMQKTSSWEMNYLHDIMLTT